jgi:hypothetical protein
VFFLRPIPSKRENYWVTEFPDRPNFSSGLAETLCKELATLQFNNEDSFSPKNAIDV